MPGESDGIDWDDVVDVICVGMSPGVLAYAVCCAAADLDVLIVDAPEVPDPRIDELYAAMTEDLGLDSRGDASVDNADSSADAACPVRNRILVEEGQEEGRPQAGFYGKREVLEPFVGEHLRQWSARCVGSPCAVMFTQVSDVLVPMRTSDGTSVTAAVIGSEARSAPEDWLRAKVDALGLAAGRAMAATVFEDGRIAGVQLADGALVRATSGLALPVGVQTPGPVPPDGEVALVGRQAGRFARVEFFGA